MNDKQLTHLKKLYFNKIRTWDYEPDMASYQLKRRDKTFIITDVYASSVEGIYKFRCRSIPNNHIYEIYESELGLSSRVDNKF
jgi:hypothetical protein